MSLLGGIKDRAALGCLPLFDGFLPVLWSARQGAQIAQLHEVEQGIYYDVEQEVCSPSLEPGHLLDVVRFRGMSRPSRSNMDGCFFGVV